MEITDVGRENTDNTENNRKKYGHLIGLKRGSKCKYFKEYKAFSTFANYQTL